MLDHKGKYFSVKGPLNTSRPPQGHPIIVQSGSSEPGQQLAARTADVVFTAHADLDSAQAFYRELKGRLAAFGREPEMLAIMPGLMPVLGGTENEARDKLALLDGWTDQSKVVPHAVRPARPRHVAATISTGRCRNCRRPISCRAARKLLTDSRGGTTSRSANSPRWSPPAAATT